MGPWLGVLAAAGAAISLMVGLRAVFEKNDDLFWGMVILVAILTAIAYGVFVSTSV
jgi:hypothetical protein